MRTDLTEEEMRQALFGGSGVVVSTAPQNAVQVSAPLTHVLVAKRKASRSSNSKMVVTLRVGNEFEGRTDLLIHEVSTLSSLQAELDAMKVARKKFKYITLVSVKSSN